MKIWSEFQTLKEFETNKELEAFVLFLEKDGKIYHCAMDNKAVREAKNFFEISYLIPPLLLTLLRECYKPIRHDQGKVDEKK